MASPTQNLWRYWKREPQGTHVISLSALAQERNEISSSGFEAIRCFNFVCWSQIDSITLFAFSWKWLTNILLWFRTRAIISQWETLNNSIGRTEGTVLDSMWVLWRPWIILTIALRAVRYKIAKARMTSLYYCVVIPSWISEQQLLKNKPKCWSRLH